MLIEPLPALPEETPVATVAVQTSPEPTNKVAVATDYGSTAGGLIAGAMTIYGDGAIRELLAALPFIGPKMTELLVFLAVGAAVLFGGRLAGRVASYNVLDAPNVPMQPAALK